MKAEILTVGTEILLGDILNTNTQFLSKELAEMGIGIYRQVTVGDNEGRLIEALNDAFKVADIVITTGGLGPTNDDITKETCAKFLNKELIVHEESKKALEKYFKNSEKAMAVNLKQAMFPLDAIVLDNPNGTAPGCIMANDKNQYIIVLPGPPREMEPMFNNKVRPFLEKLSGKVIKSRIMRFTGIGEWDMAQRVKDLCETMDNPTVAPYAKDGECILRITAMGNNELECLDLMEPVTNEIRTRLKDNFYGFGEKTIEEIVPEMLIEKDLTIATGESLTGGLLASTIINSDKGISKSYLQGFVTYSNESKINELNVNKETLEKFGAVSKECAREMVLGLKDRTGADVCVATTGIAGPSGGTSEKPIGLTYVGIIYKDRINIYERVFGGSRNNLRRRCVKFCLEKILRHMEEERIGYEGN